MKHLLIIIALFSVTSAAFAQAETKSFDVGGVKVIFKPTTKDIINMRLYYRNGTSNYPTDKTGLKHFALIGALECGTKKYSATAVRDSLDKYDITLFGF